MHARYCESWWGRFWESCLGFWRHLYYSTVLIAYSSGRQLVASWRWFGTRFNETPAIRSTQTQTNNRRMRSSETYSCGYMPLKFSLTRLLIAVTLFAIPLAVLAPYGIVAATFAVLGGISLALIALMIQGKHTFPIIRIFLAAFVGGGFSLPSLAYDAAPGWSLFCGVLIGCSCGLFLNTMVSRFEEKDTSNDETKVEPSHDNRDDSE